MTAPPMRRSQNLAALAAVILAAASLLPLRPAVRLSCAVLAVLLILGIFATRLRTHGARRRTNRADDVYARIDRIRADRAKRSRR